MVGVPLRVAGRGQGTSKKEGTEDEERVYLSHRLQIRERERDIFKHSFTKGTSTRHTAHKKEKRKRKEREKKTGRREREEAS
jgi:hypothetical protein